MVWLGPRLMYSIARNGFPDPLIPELRGIELHLATTPIVLTLGEIDCRVHLAQRLHTAGNFDFVARYVQRAAELRTNLGAYHAFVVGPVPPSDKGPDDPAYSRSGTLQQRVVASRLLERRLCEATAQVGEPWVSAIPIGDLVGDSETGRTRGALHARRLPPQCAWRRASTRTARRRNGRKVLMTRDDVNQSSDESQLRGAMTRFVARVMFIVGNVDIGLVRPTVAAGLFFESAGLERRG